MKKRLLSVLLCFVMVLGLLPVTAYADIPEDMSTWTGKQITHVEFTAYYRDDLSANSYEKSRNTLQTGEPVDSGQIQFVPTSLTWKQGANGAATNKITAQENGDNGWRAVMRDSRVTLQDTAGYTFPLTAEGEMYRRNGNWAYNGAERWDRVYETSMPNYVQGDYRYRLYFEVLSQCLQKDGVAANQYRIAPNVTVTVKWLNSNKTENFTVHPGSGMGICNYKDQSMFKSTAGFFSSTISVTGTGRLKMDSGAVSIASVYAGENIKSFSVANLVSGGRPPYTFSKVSGPNGIDVSIDGFVSGAPESAYTTEQTLTVKVTDANGATATAVIPVQRVAAARTVIKTVVLDGLYKPNASDDPATNQAYIVSVKDANGNDITEICSLRISGIMSDWEERDDQNQKWNRLNGLFNEGKKYRYSIQFRIDNDEACTQYRMAEDMVVTAQRFNGERFILGTYCDETNYSDPHQSRYVYSPNVTAGAATQLTGKVLYTGAARFGVPLNAHADELPPGITNLVWQWQYSYTNGSTWVNIKDARETLRNEAVSLTLDETNPIDVNLKGKLIRAVAYSTNPNFAGTLYGAPLIVEKGWNMGIPVKPVIELGTDTAIRVNNAAEGQEYCWTTAPSVDANKIAMWPKDNGSSITEAQIVASTNGGQTVPNAAAGQTYYVYTRFAETKTKEAGRIVSAAVYTVPNPSAGTTSTAVTDVYYPQYPLGQRDIYLEVNSSIVVDYKITPDVADPSALSKMPTWKSTPWGSGTGDRLNLSAADGKLTITANNGTTQTGTTVMAYEDDYNPWGYTSEVDVGRKLNVYVYDPTDLSTVPRLNVGGGTIDLYVGDTYAFDFGALKGEDFLPLGSDGNPVVSKDNYTLKAFIFDSGDLGISTIYRETNDSIHINNSTIKANAVGVSRVYVFALTGDEQANSVAPIARFTVKVVDRPALTNFTVTPSEVTLPVGDTYKLTAVATPANDAGDAGTITWSSNNTSAVTVDTNGKITAVAAGTASVYATCNDVTVYSVVTVKEECESHSFYYESVGGYGHKGICGVCGYTEDDARPHDLHWYEDKDVNGNANGKMHSECPACGYRSDPVDVPNSPSNPHPIRPSSGSSTTTEKVKSAQTGDVGIALYAVLALTSYTGTALVVRGRKRK